MMQCLLRFAFGPAVGVAPGAVQLPSDGGGGVQKHSINSFSVQVAEMKDLPGFNTLGLKDVDVTSEQVRRRVEHIQKGDNPMVFEKGPKRRRLEVEL